MDGGRQAPAIALESVTKAYGPEAPAVAEVTLQVPEGALVALLGPSGCGKTTTLRLIAGLETPDAGRVLLGGAAVAGGGAWVPPEERRVGLVFQDGALFPHLSVADNIAFGIHRAARQERQRRVGELLETIGMAGLGGRYPHQLSGGQQQRVALARALAPQPRYMLLDEPFANLDASLRRELRGEVEQLVRSSGTTAVFVTHDQEEALSIADMIVVMGGGRAVQVGPPAAIYERPSTRAVAQFIGEANFLAAEARGDRATCALGEVALAEQASGPCELLIRPEQLQVDLEEGGGAQIERVTYFGHDQLLTVRLAGGERLLVRTRPQAELAAGRRVRLGVRQPLVAFAAGRQ